MQVVKKCVKHVDFPTAEKLIPKLVDLMKRGVGLGTHVRKFLTYNIGVK